MKHPLPMLFLLAGLACLALSAVGCSTVHDVPPTKGAAYVREETFALPPAQPATSHAPTSTVAEAAPLASVKPSAAKPQLITVRETFTQGENADSTSTFLRDSSGKVKLKMGANRENLTDVPPVPDYTPYVALGISGLMLIGGCVLIGYGWPQIGGWLAIGGAGGAIVSLTVSDFGWLYAAGILAVAGVVAYEKLRAYRKGQNETSLVDQAKQAVSAAVDAVTSA